MGNSGNSFIKEALECHLEGKDSYLNPLLIPALSSGAISREKLSTEDIDDLVDEITLWNLEESKTRILKQNKYIREQVSNGKLRLCSAFLIATQVRLDFLPYLSKH